METFSSIECFVCSAKNGSFSAAARQLGLTAAAVGKNVAKLELAVKVRLFHRSTRRLTLTQAGERFLNEVGPGLISIKTAVANLCSADGQPAGVLKVSVGASFGREYVMPLLPEFVLRYPGIVPDWHFGNRQVDLIGEGFDVAIGGGFDFPPGVIARELAPAARILVATAGYLDLHEPIRVPADLAGHDGILIRSPRSGRLGSLPLRNASNEQAPIELRLRMAMSDADAACMAAAQGLGVALVPKPQAVPYLQSGALQRVLPQWYVDTGVLSIYFAAHKLLPVKTRVFVDFVVEEFRNRQIAQLFAPL